MSGLLGLITGATSRLTEGLSGLENAMDKAYKNSPLGKLENSFKNSSFHTAFAGDPTKDFTFGGNGGMAHPKVEEAKFQYTDANSGMQQAMSQAGILNPSAGLLRGGSYSYEPMKPLSPYLPQRIEQQPASSEVDDPALSEIEEIERKADEIAKKKQGMLMENPNLKPVPILAE
jgi:hypothetical protein